MRRWLKGLLILLGGFILILIVGVGYIYYRMDWKYDTNENKYPHEIGYLTNTVDSRYKKCNAEKVPFGSYASAASYASIYTGDKGVFKRNIINGLMHKDSTTNGYLNLRFNINCLGEVGNVEVNQLDFNFQTKSLPKDLVDQLISLTRQPNNWKVPENLDEHDSYMYIIYRIDNGRVTEILP